MMKKYLYLILLFSVLTTGCAKHNPIDFSSSDAFFSSLNEKKIIKKENKKSISVEGTLKKNNFEKKEKEIIKKSFLLTFSSYEKKLKEKIGFDQLTILNIFNEPNLKIKHGRIKNIQFHLEFCHLDLFFLHKDETYIFKHFEIRPSNMSSSLNKKKCVRELNNKFTLIRDLN